MLFKGSLSPWEQPQMGMVCVGGQASLRLCWWGQEPPWQWLGNRGHLFLCAEAGRVIVAANRADRCSCWPSADVRAL